MTGGSRLLRALSKQRSSGVQAQRAAAMAAFAAGDSGGGPGSSTAPASLDRDGPLASSLTSDDGQGLVTPHALSFVECMDRRMRRCVA